MKRWGFPQGQGGLVGPLLVELPGAERARRRRSTASVTPEEAAAKAQADVEEIAAVARSSGPASTRRARR